MKRFLASLSLVSALALILAHPLQAGEGCKSGAGKSKAGCETKAKATTTAEATKLSPQTTCPVMGAGINKELYVDHKDQRIYVCCAGCVNELKKDPEKFIKKLEELGQTPEKINKI